MIRFVTGLPGSGKSHTIRTLLTDALSRGMDCVLLVPEQQAVLNAALAAEDQEAE